MKKNLFTKLLISYLAIILITLLAVGFFLSKLFESYYYASKEEELLRKGKEIADLIETSFLKPETMILNQNILESLDEFLDARLLIVDEQGLIIHSTLGSRGRQGMRLNPEETQQVLAGKTVVKRGYQPRFNQAMLSVALPLNHNGKVTGAVLMYSPVSGLAATVQAVKKLTLYAAVGAIILALLSGYFLSRSISRPLQHISAVTRAMAKGDFRQRVYVPAEDEIGQLALNFNNLAAELDQTITALSQQKIKLENLISNLAEGVLAVDRYGKIIEINAKARELLGTGEQETVDLPVNQIINIQGLAALFTSVLKTGENQVGEFQIGTKQIILAHVSPLAENREIYGSVGILQDITQLKQLEQLRRDFIANVSHELRTPLASIQAFVEAIMDGLIEDEATSQRYLQVIHEETLRLNRLIHELLDLALIESGQVKWAVNEVSIPDLVERVLAKLQMQINTKQISVTKDFPVDFPPVQGNQDRLEQLLINLISNSAQYTPAGGRINIFGEAAKDGVLIHIADNGPGIPEDELAFIWERFHKVDKSRTRTKVESGTGLGLAIVKNIIEAHGGYVTVKSTLGKGSDFRFWLPLSRT